MGFKMYGEKDAGVYASASLGRVYIRARVKDEIAKLVIHVTDPQDQLECHTLVAELDRLGQANQELQNFKALPLLDRALTLLDKYTVEQLHWRMAAVSGDLVLERRPGRPVTSPEGVER